MLKMQCTMCGKDVHVKGLTEEQREEIYDNPNRRKIQEILPDHTPAEREMFISGVCQICWDRMFKDED